jgi:(p)ppGpp synthase/HD superfamily hydrolase
MNARVAMALDLARFWHHGQKRDDGRDYIVHLENVQHLLELVDAPLYVQIAGCLHDVLEDTEFPKRSVARQFGSRVLDLVMQVTKEPVTGKCPVRDSEAWLIKLCDVADNCTDMGGWSEPRLRKYIKKKRDFLGLK